MTLFTLYRVYWFDGDLGGCQSWWGKRDLAERALDRVRNQMDDRPIEPSGIEVVEIDNTKTGILSFLNTYALYND